ncbi:hypothetical protein Rhopal_001078-T1 [Rhodotorula paludigena]|uniref:RIC1 C-terminal alpha solenoid region domain-containing protein n=1 Tax=Rhodotorula paludigena TaxID=86838 RepID=A0AAV5GFI1_9BASI|nr:hypothetical protein Rhopal_001078-T1 [Rhodotorula paludigena]
MYFPSPLPTTRLSISTSALPVGPSPAPKASLYKTPGRPSKGKFKDSLGGVQEEEGEEVLDISRGPCDPDGGRALWAALGREEVSVWAIRPKVVLAKLRRTPLSLRTHGSNASVHFHGSSHLIVTTSSGHHLLYSIVPATAASSSRRQTNEVYVLPGGDKAAEAWPKGPGEGQDLEGIVLRGEGERGMGIGDGVGCVCVTPSDLLVAVQDPPMLRIIPFPSPAQQPEASTSASRLPTFGKPAPAPPPTAPRRGSGWDSLPNGMSGEGGSEAVVLDEWDWLRRQPTSFIMTTSDGRAYLVRWTPPHERDAAAAAAAAQSSASLLSPVDEQTPLGDFPSSSTAAEGRSSRWTWSGVCFHPPVDTDRDDEGAVEGLREKELDKGKGASCAAVNEPMGLVAVGCEDGTIAVYNLAAPPGSTPPPPPYPASSSAASSRRDLGAALATPPDHLVVPQLSHVSALKESLRSTASALATGRVTCLSWTPDGYALACGWHLGWSLWSVYGRLGSWSVAGSLGADAGGAGHGVEGERSDAFEDHFMEGVRKCFWVDGGSELVVLCPPPVHPKKKPHDEQLFVIPFAKSAVTAAHTPDNTKSAFLQMDDRVLVYRGADQPDMSVINPESDVWQHIKIPSTYIASQYPIRYAVISSDARLIAVAGPRGLTHYNALSGRWKLFDSERDELAIRVVGGMAWWSNMLIVGCEEGGQYQLRVFSRDKPLTLADSLEVVPLDSEPLVLSVFDSSLLVYTADNTFHHFLIRHVRGSTPRLRVCGSIGFEGVVADPRKVRGLSWLVPKSQQRFGDPADDLNVATIIFLISGRLVLLRPRRAAHEEVKYDLQILADRVEFYWTHLSGIGTLENSLWAWDGGRIRVWLDALTIEKVRVDARRDAYETVRESVAIPLDFYPLAVLMDKGIIVGTHLFLHHILRFHLDRAQQREAVLLASHYSHLVYFAHALEILLHDVLEDEADSEGAIASTTSVLPRVIDFLDHFDECLQVVVNCARKTEVTRWEFLFSVVGKPRDLFEKCIASGFLKVAASYLLVLHNLEPLEQSSKDTVKLLKSAMEAGEWTLCRELLRFLYSLDRTGLILRTALSESAALPAGFFPPSANAASVTGATADFRRALTLASPPSIAATLEPHKSDGGVFPPTGRLGGLGLGDVGAATAAAGHERLV